MSKNSLTTGQVAEFCGVETWRIRRIVDALPIPAERIGTYRVIERSHLPAVLAELERRGWLPKPQEVAHAS